MSQEVVITGAGVVSALGIGMLSNLTALRQGRSGVGRVSELDTVHTEFPVGEVKVSNARLAQLCGLSENDRISRNVLLALPAAREALAMAKWKMDGSVGRLALVAGTTVGGMDITEQCYPDKMSPEVIRGHECGSSTDQLADLLGQVDRVTTVSTACSSALNAIILGLRLLQAGRVDAVLAGGMECLTRFHLNGFKSLMILDEHPCCPFDAERAGLNLGEGAGFVLLESRKHALSRGVQPLAVLSGAGNACDAYHQTASSPEGDGAQQAMTQALKDAGLQPGDIQWVHAHGTGTPNNDASESAALRAVFGSQMPAVSSTKGFTGHTTSAAGAIGTAFCLLALRHQFIPINAGFSHPDPDCVVPYRGSAYDEKVVLHNVMCNAFGFGGNDSSIVLSEWTEQDAEDDTKGNSSEGK